MYTMRIGRRGGLFLLRFCRNNNEQRLFCSSSSKVENKYTDRVKELRKELGVTLAVRSETKSDGPPVMSLSNTYTMSM